MKALHKAGIASATSALLAAAAGIGLAQDAAVPPPRPGLTAQQTTDAIKFARGTMVELRKKTEGAERPEADRREYVVAVERMAPPPERTQPAAGANDAPKTTAPRSKDAPRPAPKPSPRAVVTMYRYFDDITVFTTVDLATGKVVDVQAAQHLRTPLSEAEFDEAQALARDRSAEVKKLYNRFGDQIIAYPQFSQYNLENDPRVHRVVHLTYRVGKRELSYPRPEVDLTTRTVRVPAPAPDLEPELKPRASQDPAD